MEKHQEARVLFDLENDLGLCTDEERWKKNDTWAVKKKGQKRALRVLNSEEEAKNILLGMMKLTKFLFKIVN